ncbi:MAG TPA: NUDIX domain-containing protein, partial [Bacteroidia bacterium]|nr:NUDIX domain-containing protein [Bacteroidia bacterium]
MYKIFINNRPLILCDYNSDIQLQEDEIFAQYDSDQTLDTIIELANTMSSFFKTVYLAGENTDELLGAVQSRATLIEAAGGVVLNDNHELLLIFRKGKWDLPKGKMDAGETPQQAAMREVSEECGIGKLKIVRPLEPTFHTYLEKGKFILKKTWWYEMRCADDRPPA